MKEKKEDLAVGLVGKGTHSLKIGEKRKRSVMETEEGDGPGVPS